MYFVYNSNAAKSIFFIGKVGPQFSFVSAANYQNKDGDKIIADTKARYKTTTFGGASLGGVQHKLGKQTFLSTSVRFDYDFTNSEDDAYAGYTAAQKQTINLLVWKWG